MLLDYDFPVVPLCKAQLKDVNPVDVLMGEMFRICNVYKGGGGYDKFPAIAYKRTGIKTDKQFVVQLKGCPLKCSYCYVTPEGINGIAEFYASERLVKIFDTCLHTDDTKVFHLMGGAPALYIDYWHHIIEKLPNGTLFHSDLMLIENDYSVVDFEPLKASNCLYAVSIKGNNAEEFFEQTRTKLDEALFWKNFDTIVDSGISFYITFTDINPAEIYQQIADRYGLDVLEDSFTIKKVEYEAIK